MKRTLYLFLAILICSSCATIVSRTTYPVIVNSYPQESSIKIINRKGVEVYSGKTPATVTLKSGNGYFQRGIYTISFKKAGYKDAYYTLKADVNGWYFGNVIFGGALGLLIIDPATGAMYKLSQNVVTQSLEEDVTARATLKIISIDEIPASSRKDLIKIN